VVEMASEYTWLLGRGLRLLVSALHLTALRERAFAGPERHPRAGRTVLTVTPTGDNRTEFSPPCTTLMVRWNTTCRIPDHLAGLGRPCHNAARLSDGQLELSL
jgi:hypothetical protein